MFHVFTIFYLLLRNPSTEGILFPMSDTTPIRAIVARFSLEYSFQAMQKVLREKPFAFCAIISSGEPRYFEGVDRQNQLWFPSSDIRGCAYEGTDWNALLPLDEELIESMRDCEAVFMDTVCRLEWKTRISYDERKRMYFLHLRFWNDFIERHRINLYVSAWLPHEIPDVVIHHLCMRKKIPLVCFDVSTERDTSFIVHGFEESAAQLGKRYEELLKEYAHVKSPDEIPLNAQFAERFAALTQPAGQKPPLQSQKYPLYFDHLLELVRTAPLKILRYMIEYCTPAGMRRAFGALLRMRIMRRYNAYYDQHAIEPDFTKRFVYLALHFQPEMSTVPMGGGFADQRLLAHMLSAHLPDDVLIYVKEHPRASAWLCRSVEYYASLLAIKNVRLMKRNADSFALREHCSAVATVTGSVGFEALFRGKPVFMFGNRFYQYARGVHMIRTNEDCIAAVQSVFERNKKPTLIESKLFLKAMEETRVHGLVNPWDRKVSHLSDEQHAEACSAAILNELSVLFS